MVKTIEQKEIGEFKEYSQKAYDLSKIIKTSLFQALFLVFIIISLYYDYFLIKKSVLYEGKIVFDFMLLYLWIMMSIDIFVKYFLEKKDIKYYQKNNDSISDFKNKTYCSGCGKIISSEIFKEKKKKIIKPSKIMGPFIKGYYCKKCYKKYYLKINYLPLYICALIICVWLLLLYFLYNKQLIETNLSSIPISVITFILIPIRHIIVFIIYLKKYK